MKRIVFIALIASSFAHAADWTKLRRVAQVAGCAASMLDAGTTLRAGIAETNPLLGAGHPSAGKIIGFKVGVCATGLIMSEYRHARLNREIAGFGHDQDVRGEKIGFVSGLGQAAWFGYAAGHNLGITKIK